MQGTLIMLRPFMNVQGVAFLDDVNMKALVDIYPNTAKLYYLVQDELKRAGIERSETLVTSIDNEFVMDIESAKTKAELQFAIIRMIYVMKELVITTFLKLNKDQAQFIEEGGLRKEVERRICVDYKTVVMKAIDRFFE